MINFFKFYLTHKLYNLPDKKQCELWIAESYRIITRVCDYAVKIPDYYSRRRFPRKNLLQNYFQNFRLN